MKEKVYTEKQVTDALIQELTEVNGKLNINEGRLTERDYEALGKLAMAFKRLSN